MKQSLFFALLAVTFAVAFASPFGRGGEVQAQGRFTDSPSDPNALEEPRVFVGGGFWYASPRGEFARYVDGGFGLALDARFRLDPDGVLSLRTDLGFLQYGRETRGVCFPLPVGCRIFLDLTTSNDIFVGGIGPELAIPGRWLRPYVYGTIGFAYFSTRSSLSGSGDGRDFAETENFGDGTLAWRAGSGMQIRVHRGDHPVYLDLGVDLHKNGQVEYVREGDIVDNPDGSITIIATRSEADFTTFRIGVSVGIPSNRSDRRR